ncbi:hypothetical protein AAE478_005999 [Parahypoxylon ruwenzoriense]
MSKRSYAEFNYKDATSISQALEHAEDLLRAAKALKKELEAFRDTAEPNQKIISILERHNKKIQPAAQLLTEDEIHAAGEGDNGSHKIPKLESNSNSNSNSNRNRNSNDGSKSWQNGPTALSIPPPVSLTRWTLEDIPSSGLPSLPPILDPILEQAALTHSGSTTKPSDMSYERLEWIGDAYMYLMSTAFIYQTFPNLTPGRSSQLRERIIKNETLSNYTVRYGINKRTRFPPEFDLRGGGGLQASHKAMKKVLGDIFESYVAAAILGDPKGLSRVSTWLKSLWSTTLADEIRRESRTQSNAPLDHSTRAEGNSESQKPIKQDLNPKVLLSQMICTKTAKISYNDMGEPKKEKQSGLPWYTVGVFFDGFGEKNLLLGVGSALSKKEAGANAAVKAMENKKLMKRLQEKKEESLKSENLAIKQEYDNWS